MQNKYSQVLKDKKTLRTQSCEYVTFFYFYFAEQLVYFKICFKVSPNCSPLRLRAMSLPSLSISKV